MAGSIRRPAVLLLGLLTAIDAMAIDTYVPALPAIQADFRADASAVQATLAVFLAGIAVGQAIWGPVSDRFGRRRPLLLGLIAYIAGSLLSAAAPTLFVLILGRFLQAVGASAGLVLARAVVSDLWPGHAAARLFSTMMQILGLTALISPLIGSGLLMLGSWRGIFLVMTVIGAGCLIWTAVSMPESLPRAGRSRAGLSSLLKGFAVLFRTPGFLWTTAASAFTMGTMFALLGGSAFIFIRDLGWSANAYALLYAATSVVFIAVGQLNIWLLKRFTAATLLAAGVVLQMAIALLLLALVLSGKADGVAIGIMMTLLIGMLGLILGNAVAEAMRIAPAGIAGTASSVIGIGQFVLSALVAPLATALADVRLSVAGVAALCAICAWISAFQGRRSATR